MPASGGLVRRILEKGYPGGWPGQTGCGAGHRLCFGVLQNQLRLDWYLAQFSRIPLNKLEEAVLCILRLALYQLQAMDRVPDSAAVNEAVKLARKYSRNPRSAGLVNAVLRAYLRQRNELAEPEGASWEETMSLRYSHPQWLVEAFADPRAWEGTEVYWQRIINSRQRLYRLIPCGNLQSRCWTA